MFQLEEWTVHWLRKFPSDREAKSGRLNFLREGFLDRGPVPNLTREDFRLIYLSFGRPALAVVAHLFNMSISLSIIFSIDLPLSLRLSSFPFPQTHSSYFSYPPLFPARYNICYDIGRAYFRLSRKSPFVLGSFFLLRCRVSDAGKITYLRLRVFN